MDLTTLKSKISNYNTIEEVITDLRVIWDNCRNFNAEGSDIAMVADDFAAQVESFIEVTYTVYLFTDTNLFFYFLLINSPFSGTSSD